MTSGVPQGLVLGAALFNTFAKVHSGTERSLGKAADSTRLCAVTDILEGRGDIQRDLGRLGRWGCVKLMKSNTAKCKAAHGLGQSQVQTRARQRMDC